MGRIDGIVDRKEELADLIAGAYKRLSNAQWMAKGECDAITKERASSGLKAIDAVRQHLDNCERLIKVIRGYEAQVKAKK